MIVMPEFVQTGHQGSFDNNQILKIKIIKWLLWWKRLGIFQIQTT